MLVYILHLFNGGFSLPWYQFLLIKKMCENHNYMILFPKTFFVIYPPLIFILQCMGKRFIQIISDNDY